MKRYFVTGGAGFIGSHVVEFLCGLKVVSMSYPALSLKYLWDIDTYGMFTDEFIEKWFPPRLWSSFKNARTLYVGPLERLADWDQTSYLL